MNLLAALLAAVLLAACSPPAGRPAGTSDVDEAVPPIVGRIDLADLRRTVLATAADVAVGATIAFVDTTTSAAIATTLSDAGGSFSLSFGSYVPVVNRIYILEAVKGLGPNAVGKHAARLRTLIRFNGTAWQAITAGGATLSTSTTALCGIFGLKLALASGQQVSAADLIESVNGASYSPVANGSAAEFNQAKSLVQTMLSADLDPLANLAFNGTTGQFYQTILGNLAPDDIGDPTQHHDYIVTKGAVQSTFVWIPNFVAYQLIVPANCGGDNTTKPVGYWVGNRPTVGTKDVDWAEERFGGFYAGKYEASRSDATPGNPTTGAGASAGSTSGLKVARYCVPWTQITWDAAAQTCLAYDAHAHLMRDEEWTAMAVWATINGVSVFGNNAETSSTTFFPVARDIDSPDITFVDDPTISWGSATNDRALTGSATATASSWVGKLNLTTHTGTTEGVFDLNGNVWERTETIGLTASTGYFMIFDVALALAAPGGNYVRTLATDPQLRRFGLAATTDGSPIDYFAGDYFGKSLDVNKKATRGGSFYYGGKAGLWCHVLGYGRSVTDDGLGFRPALSF
ncbi:MAG: hypothetical protein FJZ01_00380 [Candidatus Sericytochromatia bacterium]|nr:hypothetical protein [Candidatus Tanganyikabacteria bacterium]